MKWIGQHIYDLVARFRNEVYLEDISTGTIASGGNLGLDSNNKIVKAAETSGDLTSIVAGTGLSGTSLTGPIPTLNVDAQHASINLIHNDALVVGRAAENQIDFATENKIKFKTNNANQVEIIDGAILPITNNDIDLGGGDPELSFKDLWLRGNANISGNVSGTWTGAVIPSAQLDADTAHLTTDQTFTGKKTFSDDVTFNCDNITFESANADDPNVIIKNTTNDNQAARLTFTKDRGAAMGDNDRVAEIDFVGEDASQNTQGYGKIMCQALESDNGVETGTVKIQVAEYDGTLTNGLRVAGGDADGVVDVTLGAGAASTTTIAGTLTMGSTAALTNAGLVAVANQTGITGVGTISSGTWQGTAIASAYLDTDTAHLTTNQTFTGVKTFNESINKKALHFVYTSDKFVNTTATETYFSLADSDRDQPTGSEDGIAVMMVCPLNGILKHVIINSSSNLSSKTWEFRVYRVPSGADADSGGEIKIATVASNAGPAAHVNKVISFVSATADTNVITYETGYDAETMFTAGDRVLFSLESNSDANGTPKINAVLCFELDESTI